AFAPGEELLRRGDVVDCVARHRARGRDAVAVRVRELVTRREHADELRERSQSPSGTARRDAHAGRGARELRAEVDVRVARVDCATGTRGTEVDLVDRSGGRLEQVVAGPTE